MVKKSNPLPESKAKTISATVDQSVLMQMRDIYDGPARSTGTKNNRPLFAIGSLVKISGVDWKTVKYVYNASTKWWEVLFREVENGGKTISLPTHIIEQLYLENATA